MMKKRMPFLSIGLLSGIMFSATISFAQQRIVSGYTIKSTEPSVQSIEDANNHKFIKTSRSSALIKPGKNEADTLNYPLPGEYVIYYSDEGAYISGTNEFDDLAKADVFSLTQSYHMTGLLVDFGVATGGNTQVEFAVWDNTGPGSKPGNKLGSAMLNLAGIIADVQNDVTTYVAFDPPVNLTTQFYAGFLLPTGQGDTLAVFTNTDGDTSPATAWEQWSTQAWYAYDDGSSWGLEVSNAIFPIVVPGEFLEAAFTASGTAIPVGGVVQFTDLSFGEPESWEWTFEGGTPATSVLQNPEVTYDMEGVFSVSLTVTKGTESSTKTIPNYITVSDAPPALIDTLNYPLPGTFTLYIVGDNGGYVNGSNVYNDKAKANYFPLSDEARITGVLFDFAIAKGGNPTVSMAIWDNSGNAGSPGVKIAQTDITLNAIKTDINNEQMTYVAFDPPVDVNHSFYAGFSIPNTPGDTLVVWGNDDGDTNPGTAWELWNDATWNAFSSPSSWQLNLALGIHPIVEYVTGISDHKAGFPVNIYPNPGRGLFWLHATDVFSETITIQVLSIEGKVVFGSKVEFNNGTAQLDLSYLRPGFYFLKGAGSEGVFSVKLVIR